MTMPVLPGLQNSKGTPGPLTDLLDSLPPETISQLCEVAAEWGASGEPANPVVDDPDASVDTDMDTPATEPLPGDNPVNHDEDTETLDQESEETPEEQESEGEAGAENMESLVGQVQAVAEQATTNAEQFDSLIDQANEASDRGADPKAIETLKKDAEEYVKEIEKMLKEAEKAAKQEDAEGVATIGLSIAKHGEIIEQLLQQAQVHAQGHQPTPPAAGSINQQPALALWAQKYGTRAP